MGLYDRDYMGQRPTPPQSSWLSDSMRPPASWGALLRAVGSVMLIAYLAVLAREAWHERQYRQQRRDAPQRPTVVLGPQTERDVAAAPEEERSRRRPANPDPFPDDPTWHAGPRPTIAPPPPTVAAGTRTVHKCVVGRSTTYSADAGCANGQGSTIVVATGSPDPAAPAAAAAKWRQDALAADEVRRRQDALAIEAERQRVAVAQAQAQAQAQMAQLECAGLEQQVQQLDAIARQPLPGAVQDSVRAQRERVRVRQAGMGC